MAESRPISKLIDYQNVYPGEMRLARLNAYQFPVTVRATIQEERIIPSDMPRFTDHIMTLQKCQRTEKVKCITTEGKLIFLPTSYIRKVAYTPVFEEYVFPNVSDLFVGRKRHDLTFVVITAQFQFKSTFFEIGTVLELIKSNVSRQSFLKKTKRLNVISYPDKKQHSLTMDIVGNFMKCGSPELYVKRHLKEITNIEKFPYILKLNQNTINNDNKNSKQSNLIMMMAIEKVTTDTFISCQKNKDGKLEICVFSAGISSNLEVLHGNAHIDVLDHIEIESVRSKYVDNFIHEGLHYHTKCFYGQLGISQRNRPDVTIQEGGRTDDVSVYDDNDSFCSDSDSDGYESIDGIDNKNYYREHSVPFAEDAKGTGTSHSAENNPKNGTTDILSNQNRISSKSEYINPNKTSTSASASASERHGDSSDTDEEYDIQCELAESNGEVDEILVFQGESDDDKDVYENHYRIKLNEFTSTSPKLPFGALEKISLAYDSVGKKTGKDIIFQDITLNESASQNSNAEVSSIATPLDDEQAEPNSTKKKPIPAPRKTKRRSKSSLGASPQGGRVGDSNDYHLKMVGTDQNEMTLDCSSYTTMSEANEYSPGIDSSISNLAAGITHPQSTTSPISIDRGFTYDYPFIDMQLPLGASPTKKQNLRSETSKLVLKKLSVSEVIKLLTLNGLEHRQDIFISNDIDGNLLVDLNVNSLIDMNLTLFEARKLHAYINGWRPNRKTTSSKKNDTSTLSVADLSILLTSSKFKELANFLSHENIDGKLFTEMIRDDTFVSLSEEHNISLKSFHLVKLKKIAEEAYIPKL